MNAIIYTLLESRISLRMIMILSPMETREQAETLRRAIPPEKFHWDR